MTRKPRRSRQSLCLCLLLAVLLLAAACVEAPPATSPPGPDSEAYLQLNLHSEPRPLDPQRIQDHLTATVVNAIKEGLVRKGADESIEPGHGLASEIAISGDGLTYDFTLRQVNWSDGTPFTAGDVRYAWLREIDPRTGALHAPLFYAIAGAQAAHQTAAENNAAVAEALANVAVTVVDDHHLRVELAEVTPHFLELLTLVPFMPVNQALHEEVGDLYGSSVETTASIGPFTLSEWTPDSHIQLQANAEYWDAETVGLQHVRFEFIDDDPTSATLWDMEELDAVEFLRGPLAREHAEIGNLQSTADAAVQHITFNTADGPTSSPSLRAALATSIDRTALVEAILMDGSQAATSLTPPAVSGLDGDSFAAMVGEQLPLEPDPAAADLLAAAAVELGVADITSIELTLVTTPSTDAVRQGEALAGFWQDQLGLDVQVEPAGDFHDRRMAGDFQMLAIGWGGELDDPMDFLRIWRSGNDAAWDNPEFDALLAAAQGMERQERLTHLAEAEQLLLSQGELPMAPVYWWAWAYLEHEYVRDVVRRPFGAIVELKWAYTEGRP